MNKETRRRIVKRHNNKEFTCHVDREYSVKNIEWTRKYFPDAICPCEPGACANMVREELSSGTNLQITGVDAYGKEISETISIGKGDVCVNVPGVFHSVGKIVVK